MRTNKKGFTLIELLAVIVILAIIALIATPIVLNIIAKARKSAAQDSLYGVISAAKTTYMSTLLDADQINLPTTVTCIGTGSDPACTFDQTDPATSKAWRVNFSGTIPTSGSFTINAEGNVEDVTMTAGDKDTGIWVNGFQCKVEKEKVTCS